MVTPGTTAEARTPGRPRDEAARQRILDAAVALLEEAGFANLTCDAIAERAGASKATVYRWWTNKAAVVIDAFVERVTPELPLGPTSNLEEFVRVRLRRFARVLRGRNGRLLAAVVAAAQEDPEVEAAFASHWLKPRRAVSRKILEQFQAEGQLPKEFDIGQVLDAMYGPLHYLLIVLGRQPSAEYADKLADLLLHGFLPRT